MYQANPVKIENPDISPLRILFPFFPMREFERKPYELVFVPLA